MVGGEDEDRTHDLRIANAALSQLSYPPNAGTDFNQNMRPGEGACQDDALAAPAHKLHRHAVQLLDA